MSGAIEVGQVFTHASSGVRFRIDAVSDRQVTYSVLRERVSVYRETWGSFAMNHLQRADAGAPPKPTIPLRIRVGVTADGSWIAFNSNAPHAVPMDVQQRSASEMLEDHGPVVAWHWITAEVPMPETEHGETRGEVEP